MRKLIVALALVLGLGASFAGGRMTVHPHPSYVVSPCGIRLSVAAIQNIPASQVYCLP